MLPIVLINIKSNFRGRQIFLIKEMKLFLLVLHLLISVGLCSESTSEDINDYQDEIDESQMTFYDSDPENQFMKKSSFVQMNSSHDPSIKYHRDDNSPIPPPPGSQFFKNRKRSSSISFSREELELHGAKECFCSSGDF